MNIGVEHESQIRSTPVGGFIAMALRKLVVGVSAAWSQEHNTDDTHGDVTADSVSSRSWFMVTAVTYGALPTSPKTGTVACVSDATVNTAGSTVSTGGGSYTVLVWRNASAWTVIGV